MTTYFAAIFHRRHATTWLAVALSCAAWASASAQSVVQPLVEINTASRARLESLQGVGPALADRIIEQRSRRPFHDWADVARRVKGISAKTADKLRGQGVRVGSTPGDGSALAAVPVAVPAPASGASPASSSTLSPRTDNSSPALDPP